MTLVDEGTPRRSRRRIKEQKVFEFCYPEVEREFRMINKDLLVIPVDDYQRDEIDGRIANTIALKFDIVAFGALTVIDSITGQLLVADGGTRLSGTRKRLDITDVPCLVFTNMTREQEAETFLRINQERKKLSTPQLQHAEVFAKFDLALTVENHMGNLRNARVGFDSLRELRSCCKGSSKATASIIEFLILGSVDRHVSAKLFRALIALEGILNKEEKTLVRKSTLVKFQMEFGKLDAVLNAVSPTRFAASRRVLAEALARQLKIRIPKEGAVR